MALNFVVDKLEDVEEPLRQHYVADNGKFRLQTTDPRVAEFRDKNVTLLKEVARFEGIDPDAVKADRAKIVTLEAQVATTPQRVSELESQLAAEKTARATAETVANRGVLRDTLAAKAMAAGVLPAALDILIGKAEAMFEVKNGTVTAKPNTFSPSKPGELITMDEWVSDASKEFPFLFGPSGGGGASPRQSGGGRPNDGKRVLTNPTPKELGEHASAIAKGTIRVEYTDQRGL